MCGKELNKYYGQTKATILNPLSNKAKHFENVKKKGENAGYEHFDFSHFPVLFTGLSNTSSFIFVPFVKDNATKSSIRYFENHAYRILCETEGSRPY